tara:strand:- start:416 stop:619 length:204 start_codon:yes stop_codon:yes gene_type:complete
MFFFIFWAGAGDHLREQKSIKKHQLSQMIQREVIKANPSCSSTGLMDFLFSSEYLAVLRRWSNGMGY